MEFYQNLPMHLDPIALQIGFFSIGWYSLMYLAAFGTVYLLLRLRLKKDKIAFNFSVEKLESFMLWAILGVVIGGRLGYVFFYEPAYFLVNPLSVISPFDQVGNLVGIYGMSYHGGALGVILATLIFGKKYKITFWALADFVIPAIPAGYFFGRMGNFLNGELFGRLTNSWWGMYFYNSNTLAWELRVPSQLLEAFFEGLILFLILWFLRNKKYMAGKFLSAYLLSYGIVRFFLEFVREPDWQIGFVGNFLGVQITLGQVYSLIMIALAVVAYFFSRQLTKDAR